MSSPTTANISKEKETLRAYATASFKKTKNWIHADKTFGHKDQIKHIHIKRKSFLKLVSWSKRKEKKTDYCIPQVVQNLQHNGSRIQQSKHDQHRQLMSRWISPLSKNNGLKNCFIPKNKKVTYFMPLRRLQDKLIAESQTKMDPAKTIFTKKKKKSKINSHVRCNFFAFNISS